MSSYLVPNKVLAQEIYKATPIMLCKLAALLELASKADMPEFREELKKILEGLVPTLFLSGLDLDLTERTGNAIRGKNFLIADLVFNVDKLNLPGLGKGGISEIKVQLSRRGLKHEEEI
ncbi:MAG: hypothetical protein KBC21_02170 [Candidatus Pacebacteria bacterium]|nr:hypothetical protein [Candidatus Paceibacterota bacterium]